MTNIRTNSDSVTTKNNGQNTGAKTPRLDTLAQLDHAPPKNTNADAYETLQKRACSKYYTNKILFPLLDLKNERYKAYKNTYYCCNELTQTIEGKVITKYCKNRWCITCNRIRTAILHNTHQRSLESVKTMFVTITSDLTKTCYTKEDLEKAYALMIYTFSLVWRRMKRKYGKLKCLRKFEVTWKYYRGTFHPHFHIILENNSDEAEFLVKQWLELMPDANPSSQHISNTTEKTFNEMFKYLCKMWSTKENKNTGKMDLLLPYPAQKMDDIFSALQGKRLIQTYYLSNTKIKDIEDFEVEKATVFIDEIRDYLIKWNWEQELKTWCDYSTGELRTEWRDFIEESRLKKINKKKKVCNSE